MTEYTVFPRCYIKYSLCFIISLLDICKNPFQRGFQKQNDRDSMILYEQLQKPLKEWFQKQNDRDSMILYEHFKKPF